MRWMFAVVTGMLCMSSAVIAQVPTVTATVTATSDWVVYNYHLINTASSPVFEFAVYAPGRAASTIKSFTTSQEAWDAGISRANDEFVCLDWHWLSGTTATSIALGESADFGFTTIAGVPITYEYTFPGSSANWFWDDLPAGVLPVPEPRPRTILPRRSHLRLGGSGWGCAEAKKVTLRHSISSQMAGVVSSSHCDFYCSAPAYLIPNFGSL